MVLALAGRTLAARTSGITAVLLLGGGGTGLLVAGIVLILILAVGVGDGAHNGSTPPAAVSCPVGAATCLAEAFDPGNIISDREFYDRAAMTETQIRAFIDEQGATCTGSDCLRAVRVAMPDQPADPYCAAMTGGTDLDAAAVIARVSTACGVNPKVMLVTLQKESRLLTRTDPTTGSYAAAWGWHCPDTGPGGTANCDPAHAGLVNQAYGMAKQWSRYRMDPDKYTYRAGQTAQILFNVAESGCGAAPVTITNTATASLYNYTPYQPNPASLAAYPGTGDRCSSYGNRNFFFLYQSYFGSTGGGTPITAEPADGPVGGAGATVELPTAAGITGTITAPTERAATAIRAALSTLGTPYAWGGGNSQGPTLGIKDGCSQLCQIHQDWTITGFDCSGLTLYAWAQAGVALPHGSYDQVNQGRQHPYSQAQPGDLLFWGGTQIHHVALYLGTLDSRDYMVEAPGSGEIVTVSVVRTGGDFNNIAVTPTPPA